MFEIFHDKMLSNNQKDEQRRWHYYDTLENFNYKVNLPIIDFYQHWRPQEKRGYKCQDWDGQCPARDHKHVNHVKIHSAPDSWLAPAGAEGRDSMETLPPKRKAVQKQRGKEKWRTQNEDKAKEERNTGNRLKKLNRHDNDMQQRILEKTLDFIWSYKGNC